MKYNSGSRIITSKGLFLVLIGIFWLEIHTGAALAEAYHLGPGDMITLTGLRAEDLSGKPIKVGDDGRVVIPPFGSVLVAGLSLRDAEAAVSVRLESFFHNPQITLSIVEYASRPVSVMGAVNKPGVYYLHGPQRLADLISLAGGPRPDSGYRVTVTRRENEGAIALPGARHSGETFVADISLTDIMSGSTPGGNIDIRPHDLIAVPQARMIYVVGDVKKSGGFVLGELENVTLLQALSLAEGLIPTAATAHAKILRQAGKASRTEIAVDLRKILRGKGNDVPMVENDILFIPSSTGKKAAFRALDALLQAGTGMAVWRRF